MSLSYIKFYNIRLRSISNPNLVIDCSHRAYEDIIEGCRRIADEYRFQNDRSEKFYVEINEKPLVDSYNSKVQI
jgi:hypothetical protein